MVDDDAVFREELAELLRDDGHEVTTAPSVAKAVELLEHQEVDTVLTDLKMPRHGGLELLRDVRQRWPRTPVVMVTGFATVESALEAMKLGAFDYIRKPFRIEQVRETLALVAQEREFSAPGESARDPVREARNLAASGKYEVLLFDAPAPASGAHLTGALLDPTRPSELVDRTGEFLAAHPTGAVVIAHAEQLLADHRLEEVVGILDRLRTLLVGHGPLRVAFDPHRVGPAAALAMGGAVAAEETHAALEALSNPIRRRALLRLAEAPASFTEILTATELSDSPKLSFHLRKLVDAALLRHDGDRYRLTSRGEAVVRLLRDATFLPPASTAGNLAFPRADGEPGPSARPGGKTR